jgi:hypothetical protein
MEDPNKLVLDRSKMVPAQLETTIVIPDDPFSKQMYMIEKQAAYGRLLSEFIKMNIIELNQPYLIRFVAQEVE